MTHVPVVSVVEQSYTTTRTAATTLATTMIL